MCDDDRAPNRDTYPCDIGVRVVTIEAVSVISSVYCDQPRVEKVLLLTGQHVVTSVTRPMSRICHEFVTYLLLRHWLCAG